jgi:hypothetical protein
MATTTPNFGWAVPTSTDLVKDGAVAIETLGDSIDASLVDLKGGTTNQVLAKNSNTDMDFKWVADAAGMTNPMTTTGDTIYSSSGSTPARLGIGSTGQILTVAGGIPSWATPAAGASGLTKIVSSAFSNVASTGTTFDGCFTSTYDNYLVVCYGLYSSSNNSNFQYQTRNAGSTQSSGYFGAYVRGTTLTSTSGGSAFNVCNLRDVATQQAVITFQVYRNTDNQMTTYTGADRGVADQAMSGGWQRGAGANSIDGFILSASSGNLYGTATVYGIQK